ncbi:MAG: type VI secretion system tube protein Hcp, partial [Mycobacteriaceae bacterium]|nr:type VI secretion system tube protein Hcp [Mycobacteriaceae bacterium]
IKGESKDSKHPEEIDVLAWSWGMSQSGTTHMGGGGGAGKVNVQDLSFTQYVEKSSATLMVACATGKHIAKGNLVVRKAGDKPFEYIKIEMTDLIVTSVSTGGSGGEDRLTQNVTLNFAKVKLEYFEQDKTGGAKGGPATLSYDMSKNATF